MNEYRYRWGRAYRDGKLVCGRVEVIVEHGRDERLGLAPHERRCIAARFVEPPEADLQVDLERLLDAGGVRGLRLAERLAPIELVVDDRGGLVVGRLEPPTSRNRPLEDIDFRVRETS